MTPETKAAFDRLHNLFGGRPDPAEQERQVAIEKWERRANNYMEKMARAGRTMMTTMRELEKVAAARPPGTPLRITPEFREAMDTIKKMVAISNARQS